jgi:hypothetical protein
MGTLALGVPRSRLAELPWNWFAINVIDAAVPSRQVHVCLPKRPDGACCIAEDDRLGRVDPGNFALGAHSITFVGAAGLAKLILPALCSWDDLC